MFRDYHILMAMNRPRTHRLKPLLQTVPPGFLVDTRWLKARGIDSKSIHDYVSRGWLERVVRGVYRRPLPRGIPAAGVSWEVVLVSLQRLMGCKVHLGGEGALKLAGHTHYPNLGETPYYAHLYGHVPSWLKHLPIPQRIVVRRCTLFGNDPEGIGKVSHEGGGDGPSVEVWRWPIRASSPERAILEALDELPGNASFEHLDKIFEGLVALRPESLMTLLSACRSVKVRRKRSVCG